MCWWLPQYGGISPYFFYFTSARYWLALTYSIIFRRYHSVIIYIPENTVKTQYENTAQLFLAFDCNCGASLKTKEKPRHFIHSKYYWSSKLEMRYEKAEVVFPTSVGMYPQ